MKLVQTYSGMLAKIAGLAFFYFGLHLHLPANFRLEGTLLGYSIRGG
jgi:hypothetical protein